MAEQIVIEVAENGTLTIPAELLQKIHAKPHQSVIVRVVQDQLTVELTERERLAEISALLHEILAGAPWAEIKEGRRDR